MNRDTKYKVRTFSSGRQRNPVIIPKSWREERSSVVVKSQTCLPQSQHIFSTKHHQCQHLQTQQYQGWFLFYRENSVAAPSHQPVVEQVNMLNLTLATSWAHLLLPPLLLLLRCQESSSLGEQVKRSFSADKNAPPWKHPSGKHSLLRRRRGKFFIFPRWTCAPVMDKLWCKGALFKVFILLEEKPHLRGKHLVFAASSHLTWCSFEVDKRAPIQKAEQKLSKVAQSLPVKVANQRDIVTLVSLHFFFILPPQCQE